jgi:hypothetical protein
MGIEIDREHFAPAEYARFRERLSACLSALEGLLARPGFGAGETTLGAELEVSLVDAAARPLPMNREVLAGTFDPRLTFELDRFNLECNLRHGPLAGRPFEALRWQITGAVAEMNRAAASHGGRIAMIGILPTLREADLDRETMTDSMRYRALSTALRGQRGGPFRVSIHGEDHLHVTSEDVTFEGAATSFQIHLRVRPEEFATSFNAVQMATAPVLAAAGNSPIFLGRRLWEETRVALFKQAVDSRDDGFRSQVEPRVSFGRSWVDESALELFSESVALHPPLLPVLDAEDPTAVTEGGGVASLRELRLHQGTVWSWNRPVYDAAEGGHLRIEMRALPSGPTPTDMLANAAFFVGLALHLRPQAREWAQGLPFADAHNNFYRAAQHGLRTELLWPPEPGAPPARMPAQELALLLLPLAQAGLDGAGVARDDSEPLLALLERRIALGMTGARWQREMLARLRTTSPPDEALAALLERSLALCAEGEPVHTWPITEAG